MTHPAIFLTLSVSCAFLKRSYLRVPSENFFFLTAVASPPPFIKLPRKEAMIGARVLVPSSEIVAMNCGLAIRGEHLVCEDWDQMAYCALENTNGRFTCSSPLALGVNEFTVSNKLKHVSVGPPTYNGGNFGLVSLSCCARYHASTILRSSPFLILFRRSA